MFTQWWNSGGFDGEFYKTPASGGLRWTKRDDVIGDLCTPEGFNATVECKNQEQWKFKELFGETIARKPKMVKKGKGQGKYSSPKNIGEFWYQAVSEGIKADKIPMLIFTKNYFPDYIIFPAKDNNVASLYAEEFCKVGVTKRFIMESYLPYMEYTYILKLEDFMNIVEPKILRKV